MLKELLATQIVSVELHDCDEYIENEEDAKVAKFSAGRAKFTFRDFLRKNVLELKLRSDIFPLKRDEVDNTNNLDLNTTARKGEKTVEKASPYLINNTFSVIIANLARPIGPFDFDHELFVYKKWLKAQKVDESGEQTEKQTEKSQTEKSQADQTHDEIDNKTTIQSAVEAPVWNENEAIFERLVLIIPYKSPDMVK